MKTYDITLKFISDWHIGTGIGLPGVSDNMLLRDNNGFPFIPGRSIRGVLRDTHEKLWKLEHLKGISHLRPSVIWGTHKLRDKNTHSQTGKWRVEDGIWDAYKNTSLQHAPEDIRNIWLNEISFVSPRISLDENHKAKNQQLGFIELGRKDMTFDAKIYRHDGSEFEKDELNLLRLLLLHTQRIGGTRRRGKGRVEMTLARDGSRAEMLEKWRAGNNV
ncbi:MAG: RAMP superfamily CRISPR-associated protein [Calditrichaceae bacterium]